jgi:hypothetical protein
MIRLNQSSILHGIYATKIEAYKKIKTVCEICGLDVKTKKSTKGKPLTLRPCVDPNTKLFRGMLCSDCLKGMIWYDRNKQRAERFLIFNKFELVEKKINLAIQQK